MVLAEVSAVSHQCFTHVLSLQINPWSVPELS